MVSSRLISLLLKLCFFKYLWLAIMIHLRQPNLIFATKIYIYIKKKVGVDYTSTLCAIMTFPILPSFPYFFFYRTTRWLVSKINIMHETTLIICIQQININIISHLDPPCWSQKATHNICHVVVTKKFSPCEAHGNYES